MPIPRNPRSYLSTSPKLQDKALDWVQYGADLLNWAMPRPMPSSQQLQQLKLIAHRGAHGSQGPTENTLEAFDRAQRAGVWGLEFDVRWTADQVPVVFHDEDCQRVFGLPLQIHSVPFVELRRQLPQIPTLEEVIQRYGGHMHLMIEHKVVQWQQRDEQLNMLRTLLAGLQPGQDYHWLAVDFDFLAALDVVDRCYRLPVTAFDVDAWAPRVLAEGYAGLGGHYLLLNNRWWQPFKVAGLQFGVGFPASENALRREALRDIQWVFTNDAARLQGMRDALLAKAG